MKKYRKIELKQFEATCNRLAPEYYGKTWKLKGRNAEMNHKLQAPFYRIATKYFYSDGVAFPAEIVQRIAKEMDIYVTDLIRLTR